MHSVMECTAFIMPLAFGLAHKRANTLELEVVLSVVVRDVLNHAREVLHVVRYKTLFNVCTEDVTEETTEVLVTWVREERTRVSQHTYEAREKTEH